MAIAVNLRLRFMIIFLPYNGLPNDLRLITPECPLAKDFQQQVFPHKLTVYCHRYRDRDHRRRGCLHDKRTGRDPNCLSVNSDF